jgi:hypothetical protein
VRTYLVTGSNSEVGALVCAKLKCTENRVVRVDAHGGDINADLSTAPGRLELAERAIELTGGQVDAIITTSNTNVNKPVAISNNFYGITQLIEALNDELRKSSTPRVAILNFYDETKSISTELLESILHATEKKALKIAQQILETTPDLAQQNYVTSQKALQSWVYETGQKKFLRKRKIFVNSVTANKTASASEIAELLIWLASPANQTHNGEVFNANALIELSPAL